MPSLEEFRKSLAMTPQTLRRWLQEEGQGYQAIKDDLRRDAAIEHLARSGLVLIDIANMLGFSEPLPSILRSRNGLVWLRDTSILYRLLPACP